MSSKQGRIVNFIYVHDEPGKERYLNVFHVGSLRWVYRLWLAKGDAELRFGLYVKE
jgi:hypothetical protein